MYGSTEKYFAAQSLDNQILIYSADNFRQNRKKRFAGHSTAGYACQVGFSPDGKWISSGDSEGNVVFWDWKSGRIKSRLKAHSKVVIAHEWLPHDTVSPVHSVGVMSCWLTSSSQSKVITASWDGLIKLWVRALSGSFFWHFDAYHWPTGLIVQCTITVCDVMALQPALLAKPDGATSPVNINHRSKVRSHHHVLMPHLLCLTSSCWETHFACTGPCLFPSAPVRLLFQL